MVRQTDVLSIAHADRALCLPPVGRGAETALEMAFAGCWQDYLLTYTSWGVGRDPASAQLSRKGGNLVVQVGFPSDHSAILGQLQRRVNRSDFEYRSQPVRTQGCAPPTRDAKSLRRYAVELARTYANRWPNVALLSALMLVRDELGIGTICKHQPASGAVLKTIYGRHSPHSLYTRLPKRFGFRPVREAPPFLLRPRPRALSKIRTFKSPLFWRLDLG